MFRKKFFKKRGNLLKYIRSKYAPINANKPLDNKYTFSDLFFWRIKNNWETEFDLMPYQDLLNPNNKNIKEERLSKLLIISKEGKIINQEVLKTNRLKKNIIKISDYVPKSHKDNEYGNFLIFHKYLENKNNLKEGFITDRGYIKYNFHKKDIFTYTHANLDAISGDFNKIDPKYFTFTKSTILKRTYRIQYLFSKKYNYDITLSNPTIKKQNYEIIYFNTQMKKILSKKIKINSLGIEIVKSPFLNSDYYIFIKSNLPMSRPSIFKFENDLVDIFHG